MNWTMSNVTIYKFLFWIALLLLFLDKLIPEGMFLDGLTYASIARNMVQENTGFWKLIYLKEFYEHPPLMMYLESLIFRVLGDSIYVERLYSVLVYILLMMSLYHLWMILLDKYTLRYGLYITWAVYALFPDITWGVPNNLLDSTLSVFANYSIYFMLLGTRLDKSRWIFWSISILLFWSAFLTKGVVAGFLLTAPALLVILKMCNKGIAIRYYVLWLGYSIPVIFYFFLNSDASCFWYEYIDYQVVRNMKSVTHSLTSEWQRLGNIIDLFTRQFLLGYILLAIGFWYFFGYKKSKKFKLQSFREFQFLAFLGLSAVFPFVLSAKQYTYYLIPSLSYFGLLFGGLLSLLFSEVRIDRKQISFLYGCSIILLVSVLFIVYLSQKIYVGRERDLIADMKEAKSLLYQKDIQICPDAILDYYFLAYMERYAAVRLVDSSTLWVLHHPCYVDETKYLNVYKGREVAIYKRISNHAF